MSDVAVDKNLTFPRILRNVERPRPPKEVYLMIIRPPNVSLTRQLPHGYRIVVRAACDEDPLGHSKQGECVFGGIVSE